MDLQIEANRNSALFNTIQQVLDVYNPLLHKARPTVVNQAKHRINVQPTRWASTLSSWTGQQTVRFDLPRIGSLSDFTLRCAFRIPGVAPTEVQRTLYGDRGYAKDTLTTGGLVNDRSTSDTARGRLDRVYADRLLGFNMIRAYHVQSKSRRLFSGTGEYLLTRFSQMDPAMQSAVLAATTPVDIQHPDVDSTFYAPAVTYEMAIPLFMFFNEHITMALDVNFSEEVHIDIELRSPSEVFYYGNLGNYRLGDAATGSGTSGTDAIRPPGFWTRYSPSVIGTLDLANGQYSALVANTAPITWDMSYNHRETGADADTTAQTFSYNQAFNLSGTDLTTLTQGEIQMMLDYAMNHIRGLGAPLSAADADGLLSYGSAIRNAQSAGTFAFPDVDNNGESVQIQFMGAADYIVQDTDAYRKLRAASFPEGTGLTVIAYDVAQESHDRLIAESNVSDTLLSIERGGSFTDPSNSTQGLVVGDTTRFVDIQIRSNNLATSTHFMVRKVSDMTGQRSSVASNTGVATAFSAVASTNQLTYGANVESTASQLGAHKIFTRALKVHSFQVMAAGRIIYESDGKVQLNLTQTKMYQGTGSTFVPSQRNLTWGDSSNFDADWLNVYTINWGLQASRLENTGCISWQNLNNPVLRIYWKPEDWAEHESDDNTTTASEAAKAASYGVRVDIIHEHFNVITINSDNGEITSGLNQ